MGQKIRILLVDDHELARQGLRHMLELEQDMKVVGETDNAEEALAKAELLSPDVVLLDVKMPKMNGIEAAQILNEKGLNCAVVMLTLYDEFLLQALQAGARGYLVKDIKRGELVGAIRRVHQGELVISNSLLATSRITEVLRYFQDIVQEKMTVKVKPINQQAKTKTFPDEQEGKDETSNLEVTKERLITSFQGRAVAELPHSAGEAVEKALLEVSQGDETDRDTLEGMEERARVPVEIKAELMVPSSVDAVQLLRFISQLSGMPDISIYQTVGSQRLGTTMKVLLRKRMPFLEAVRALPDVETAQEMLNPQEKGTKQIIVMLKQRDSINSPSEFSESFGAQQQLQSPQTVAPPSISNPATKPTTRSSTKRKTGGTLKRCGNS